MLEASTSQIPGVSIYSWRGLTSQTEKSQKTPKTTIFDQLKCIGLTTSRIIGLSRFDPWGCFGQPLYDIVVLVDGASICGVVASTVALALS